MIDPDKLSTILEELGYGQHPEHAKMAEAAKAIAVTLGSYGLSEESEDILLDLLSTSGREAINKLPQLGEDVWESFNYGNVTIGHMVRVKLDAYDSDTGKLHNGRVGILSWMSGGRCRVNYIGLDAGKSQMHPYQNLDSLKLG